MKRTLLNLALLASMAVAGSAATVWNTYVGQNNWTGSRTAPDSIVTGGNYDDGFSVAWNILPLDGTGLYQYTYTFTGFPSPAISHFILELSDNCEAGDPCFSEDYSQTVNGPEEWSDGSGNPGFPDVTIWGVKFDFGTSSPATFTFTSDRIPVWGNFYVKGGNDSYAYNNGLGIADFESMDVLDFIARPDTERIPPSEVPEPATYALIGGTLVALQVLRKRK